MRFWFRDHQEMDLAAAVVKDAMTDFWGDVDGLPLLYGYCFVFHLKSGGSLQNVKHLLGALVVMRLFGSAGGHPFLYHGKAVGTQQMPAVALVAPGVMVGVLGRSDEFIHGCFLRIAAAVCVGRGYTRQFVPVRSTPPAQPFAGSPAYNHN